MSETGSKTFGTKYFSGQFSYGLVKCSFDNPGSLFFLKKCNFLLPNVQNWIEKTNLSKKIIALKKTSPWFPKKQLRQSGWIFFAKMPKLFRSKSKKYWKKVEVLSKCCLYRKVSYGHLVCSFEDPTEQFRKKAENVSLNGPKKLEQPTFSNMFSPKFPPMDTKNAVLTTLPSFFDTRPNLFTLMSTTKKNTFSFKEKQFSSKSQLYGRTSRMKFRLPQLKESRVRRINFVHCMKTMQKKHSGKNN